MDNHTFHGAPLRIWSGTVQPVAAPVGAQQREHLARLGPAAALVAEQAVQEAAGDRPQLDEAFAQERQLLRRVVARPVGLVLAALTGQVAGEQTMACKARNLCVGCLIEAVRSATKAIDIDNVNRVLLQPHWQKDADLVDF